MPRLYSVKAPLELSRLISAVGVEAALNLPGAGGLYLGDVISPVFDWLKLRETYPGQYVEALGSGPAGGDKTAFTVPAGFRWELLVLSWAVQTGNFTIQFVRVQSSGAAFNVPVKTYSPAAQSDYGWFPPNPLLLDQGDAIVLSVNSVTTEGNVRVWALVRQSRSY